MGPSINTFSRVHFGNSASTDSSSPTPVRMMVFTQPPGEAFFANTDIWVRPEILPHHCREYETVGGHMIRSWFAIVRERLDNLKQRIFGA